MVGDLDGQAEAVTAVGGDDERAALDRGEGRSVTKAR